MQTRIPFTQLQQDFEIQQNIRSKKAEENCYRLEQILDLYRTNEITIEQVLLGLEGFAQEKCVNMLELEDAARVALFNNMLGHFQIFVNTQVSRKLHDIVIRWYSYRIDSGDKCAEDELLNYRIMIGDIKITEN